MTPLRKLMTDLPFASHDETTAAVVRPVDFAEAHDGAAPVSPARELQQRLERAALQSFYAVAEPEGEVSRWGGARRVAIILVAAVGTWTLLFGLGRGILA